jgi:hypothetical protein
LYVWAHRSELGPKPEATMDAMASDPMVAD